MNAYEAEINILKLDMVTLSTQLKNAKQKCSLLEEKFMTEAEAEVINIKARLDYVNTFNKVEMLKLKEMFQERMLSEKIKQKKDLDEGCNRSIESLGNLLKLFE
uniref:Uncharacterized protein n=1 Tax=Corethron hystrix TaxID=216773 RepID=A0A7S1FUM8_9STRA|mmetsp:Transcript_33398/g.77053  ORF Transcript_33398/g.77053 Transcript_33398/m.77053 type:complete len:104 (+) Transcript_33398:173-484(+)